MARIRTFVQDDIPEVGSLYRRTFGEAARPASERQLDYFDLVVFKNPCRDDALPSLIYEDDRGKIV